MYLTRMELDLSKRSTLRILNAPNMIHGVVESAFSGERVRNLWRIDQIYAKTYLMIVSKERPDLSVAVKQYGSLKEGSGWETRDYEPFLGRIKAGSVWHFRLVANPTKSGKPEGEKKRGKVYAETSVKYQMEWLLKQADKHGFELHPESFQVVSNGWQIFEKGTGNKHKVSLIKVSYEGILTVLDEIKFRNLLETGIGRGKAYGMGLMTVVSLEGGVHG